MHSHIYIINLIFTETWSIICLSWLLSYTIILMNEGKLILALNAGSSSIKYVVYDQNLDEKLKGQTENIGQDNSHTDALNEILDKVNDTFGLDSLNAIGHRIVNGGPHLKSSRVIDENVRSELETYAYFDPDHMPVILEIIDSIKSRLPEIDQVACFDSEFFNDLPDESKYLAVPREFREKGITKNGFHGLSYSYLLSQVPDYANKKIVFAHLGSGASLCAVSKGKPIDTTMSFSPTSGIPMSSRSGDLDPTISLFLTKHEGLNADQINDIFNHSSGLKGISGVSGDMKYLLENQNNNPDCAEAVKKFVYEVKKTIGAYSAIMGGIDCLIFSGGIGERSSEIRSRICAGLDFLNIKLDPQKNEKPEQIISVSDTIEVMVMPTNEEYIIGMQTLQKI